MLHENGQPRQQQRRRQQSHDGERTGPSPGPVAARRGDEDERRHDQEQDARQRRERRHGRHAERTQRTRAQPARTDLRPAECRPDAGQQERQQDVHHHDVDSTLRRGSSGRGQQSVGRRDRRSDPPPRPQSPGGGVRAQRRQRNIGQQQQRHGSGGAAQRRQRSSEDTQHGEGRWRTAGGTTSHAVPCGEVLAPHLTEIADRQKCASDEGDAEPTGVQDRGERRQHDDQHRRRHPTRSRRLPHPGLTGPVQPRVPGNTPLIAACSTSTRVSARMLDAPDRWPAREPGRPTHRSKR